MDRGKELYCFNVTDSSSIVYRASIPPEIVFLHLQYLPLMHLSFVYPFHGDGAINNAGVGGFGKVFP